jgi:hypothetical protein
MKARRGEEKDCEICGTITYFSPNRIRKNKHFTCSKKCMGTLSSKIYSEKITVECFICKKDILYKKSHIKQISYPTCSSECNSKMRSIIQVGKKNANSRGLNSDLEKFFWEKCKELQNRAKANKVPFDLDYKYLESLYNFQNGTCFYSGLKMKLKSINFSNKKCADYDVLSVDRIIPKNGYTKGNVVYCLNCLNMLKSNHDLNDVKKVFKAISLKEENGNQIQEIRRFSQEAH